VINTSNREAYVGVIPRERFWGAHSLPGETVGGFRADDFLCLRERGQDRRRRGTAH
jgi:hypothetical protein